jgi:hypothetical protein
MPRRRNTESLHRPNQAQAGGVWSWLDCYLCDQPSLPLRKETFALYSHLQFEVRSMCRQRQNSFAYLA